MRSAVVLGKGDLAVRIAKWFRDSGEYDLRHIVPVMPEPVWTSSLSDWALTNGVDHVSSGDYRDMPGVDQDRWSIDLALSVFYDKIIPPWFIAKCGRILNVHNGPLPRYRGVSPINWALKNGERMHGVTIHEITPGVDDGPIVAQLTYSIYPEFDEVEDVLWRALGYGWTLFERTMPIIDRIEARPQVEAEATYYSADQNDLLGDRRGFTRASSRAGGS